ncbi:MAG: right-handed parallel beta-helix repeat-containing protein, partial [Clostridiales bacterium]|nr:right-handed parallel beta-helix repeat-containing protein [Clostridiales bacterium]
IEVPASAQNVTIQDLSFAVEPSVTDADAIALPGDLLRIEGSGCFFAGNNLSGDFGVAVTIQGAEHAVVKDNGIAGFDTAVDVVGAVNPLIQSNVISETARIGVAVRGGSRGALVCDNRISATAVTDGIAAIRFGGEFAEDPAYDSDARNNIITAESPASVTAGAEYRDAEDCRLYNNIIVGTRFGVSFRGGVNLVVKNNIFMDCSPKVYEFAQEPNGFITDYNLYHNTYPEFKEPHSKFADPLFAEPFSDWHLMRGSPAIGTGGALEEDFGDFDGVKHGARWNMGVYQSISDLDAPVSGAAVKGTPLLSENFDRPLKGWKPNGGEWSVSGGKLEQGSSVSARAALCYEAGLSWKNYEYAADIKAPTDLDGNTNGILFRADEDMRNMYVFRMYAQNALEFAKWEDGSFYSIQKWEFPFIPDAAYNLKVQITDQHFTLYVNDRQVREIDDGSFSSGTIGVYTYRQTGNFDNVRVTGL